MTIKDYISFVLACLLLVFLYKYMSILIQHGNIKLNTVICCIFSFMLYNKLSPNKNE